MIIRIKKFLLHASKLDKLGEVGKHFVRRNYTQTAPKVLECLKERSVLRVRGKATSDFLQGLITNDIKHLQNGAANLYSLFLNIKGRVMYDTIVYKSQERDMFYIECDLQAVGSLERHLKMYRVRRKIDIDRLQDETSVWSLFDPYQYRSRNNSEPNYKECKLEGLIFPCASLNNEASKVIDNIMIYQDPRLRNLGFRILADSNIQREDLIKQLNSDVSSSDNTPSYKEFRYKLGLAEGIQDLPPGKPLPLEVNCDYLHGISFHKGCYIGQELTARTHHTGVVRKRLMPLVFDIVPQKVFLYDEKITNESGVVVGKFRGHQYKYGLGLMRITEALSAQSLNIAGLNIKIIKPVWWPQESQKETASVEGRK